MTLTWHKTEEKLPPLNEQVLIKYVHKKAGWRGTSGEFITQAVLRKAHASTFEWFDYLYRGIEWLGAKKSNNKVTHWAEIPTEEEKRYSPTEEMYKEIGLA